LGRSPIVAQAVYLDESGRELWRSEHGEYVPPGTMVTAPDGTRYLAVKVIATQELGGPAEAHLTMTLRPFAG
jgi:hypothetical protein